MEKAQPSKTAPKKKTLFGIGVSSIDRYEDVRYLVIFAYSALVFFAAFFFNTPEEILEGLPRILSAPSILLTDYMAVGNIGAALFNAGLLMMVVVTLAKVQGLSMTGPLVAGIFTVGGFALFGKNLYNVWPIFFGIFLYAQQKREKFSKFLIIAFFGTALGPLVSQVTFGFGFAQPLGYVLGIGAGILAGFILPPLANSFVKFHQGFSLYNIGFTAGIVGTLFMSVMRGFGLENPPTAIVIPTNNPALIFFLLLYFLSMVLVSLYPRGKSIREFPKIMEHSGRLVTDFITQHGFRSALFNMGVLGLVSTGLVLLAGGILSGPVVGGIFTVIGFGAFGKHLKNVLPIYAGILLTAVLTLGTISTTGVMLTMLFGTTLAPISGKFGWKYGLLAGFLHMSVVVNVGYLHGGMNLYNNGFSGGIVAAFLVPILTAFITEEEL